MVTFRKNKQKKTVLKWMVEHVRPHFRWNGREKLDAQDEFKTTIEKVKDNAELGIKFKFKF